MFINNFDPVAFQIMSFEIRWYSLAYIAGIIIGWLLCKKLFIKNSNINEKFDDYITYLIIGIIIGGRLGYITFYNLNYYINNFLDIFKVWEGGMSFHGGLIGVIIASILFAKKNKDYGDAFAKYGVIGVLMRMEDKIQRAMSITKNGVNLVDDEGMRDTLIDLHNYAAMAIMLMDE